MYSAIDAASRMLLEEQSGQLQAQLLQSLASMMRLETTQTSGVVLAAVRAVQMAYLHNKVPKASQGELLEPLAWLQDHGIAQEIRAVASEVHTQLSNNETLDNELIGLDLVRAEHVDDTVLGQGDDDKMINRAMQKIELKLPRVCNVLSSKQ